MYREINAIDYKDVVRIVLLKVSDDPEDEP
jgi:hypothetical protein